MEVQEIPIESGSSGAAEPTTSEVPETPAKPAKPKAKGRPKGASDIKPRKVRVRVAEQAPAEVPEREASLEPVERPVWTRQSYRSALYDTWFR